MSAIPAIIELRNLATMAFYEPSALFFLWLLEILVFIPISLLIAELASGWPKKGGIYGYVTEAFGYKTGAFAI